MAITGSRSTFNASNNWTLDNFVELFDLSPAQLADAQEYQTLLTTTNKTTEQINRLNDLTMSLQQYIINAEKWNLFLDCLYNMEVFMVTNVSSYVTAKQAEFDATLQQFSNKGNWSNTTTYQQWNTVLYNYESYLSKVDNNLNHTPVGDGTDSYWQKVALRGAQGQAGIGLSWGGAYNNGTAYSVGMAVSYNNNIYYCKSSSTGNLPTNTAYWDVFLTNSGIVVSSATPSSPYTGQPWIDTN